MDIGNVFAFMVVGIPIVAILASVAKRWMKLKERQLEVTASLTAEQAARHATEIATLKERVAVLNRIVTDRNEGLTAQIAALDDRPVRPN